LVTPFALWLDRFESVSEMATDSLVFVMAVCIIYVLAFVLISVHCALLCCVRTGLIINLNFLEERVGESPHPPMYVPRS
jgi:uncharacterized Tic20 family protein